MVVSTRTRFNFNPRSHEESGVRRNLTKLKVLLFQSTLSRGERLWQSLPEHWEQKFQSTLSRGERRGRLSGLYVRVIISIHALTRRAAAGCIMTWTSMSISIHALTRRAASRPQGRVSTFYISIHALTRRAAYLFQMCRHGDHSFQSTLSRGERLPIFPKEAVRDKISIHALTRRAARDSTKSN